MKPATTGERIVMPSVCYDDVEAFRADQHMEWVRRTARAIDAAIAEAVKAEREAIIEACNAQAAQAIVDRSHHALSCVQTIRSVIQQRDEADAAAIRARGTP